MAFDDPIFTLALYGFVAISVGVIIYTVVETAFRNHRLSTQDPPSDEELEEVEALCRPGVLSLGGRDSAAARHFEAPIRQNPHSRFGGGQTVNSPQSPAVVRRWRDSRTET